MAKEVTLSSAAMSNLLSLQNTQSMVDRTQGRLSTGKSVNSALDDAMAFFKNRNLTNRASDLSDIKSDIQNGVNIIKEAVDSLEQVDQLLKSAKAAAQSARAEKDKSVRATYIKQINENLRQIVSLAGDSNYDGINLIQNVPDLDLTKDAGAAAVAKVGDSVRKDYAEKAFVKALDEGGAALFDKASAADGTKVKFKDSTDWGIKAGEITSADSVLTGTEVTAATAGLDTPAGAYKVADQGTIYKANGSYYMLTTGDDTTPADAKFKKVDMDKVRAAFVENYNTTMDTVANLQAEATNAKGVQDFTDMLQAAAMDEVSVNRSEYETMSGFVSPERLTVIFSEQDRSRKIDVTGRSLSSVLMGLVDGGGAREVKEVDWVNVTDGKTNVGRIDDFIATIDQARSQVRAYAAELGNYSSIMSTRGEWTDNTVNTLKGGAADLVNANMNEESANMLALQTRQQLGVIALSIAQQSEQAVLRLF